MSKKFQLLSVASENQVNQTVDIAQGAGAQGKPVVIQAKAGQKYQLVDIETKVAPHNIRAKRVGKSLQVYFEDSQQADLIIEQYYDQMLGGEGGLIGQAENGSLYEYIPEDADPAGLVPNLADGGNLVGMALGNSQGFAVAAAPLLVAAAGGPGLGVIAAGLGGAALVGGAAGGTQGAPSTAPTTPTGQTGALAPASDTGVVGDNITSDKTPTLTGKAEAGATVDVTVNGKTYTTRAGTDGKYTVKITDPLPDGTHTPKIKATNSAGLSSDASGTPFKVDTSATAPSGALAAASDSGTLGDNITNDTTPEITGRTEPGAKVEIKINDKTYTTTADKDGKYSVQIPVEDKLSDGTYTPSIKVTDPAGNSTTKDGTAFKVDTGTQVAITDPGKGKTTNPIAGTGEPGAVVTVKDASGTTVGTATVGSDGKWTLTPTTSVPIGALTATAKDPAGNTVTGASDNTGAAPAAPTITSVVDNLAGLTGNIQKYTTGNTGGLDKGITNDTTPTLNGTAVPGAVVTIYDAGVAIGSTTAGGDGTWSFTPAAALAAGVHTFTARSGTADGRTGL
jgi:hypothetical protein